MVMDGYTHAHSHDESPGLRGKGCAAGGAVLASFPSTGLARAAGFSGGDDRRGWGSRGGCMWSL
jgi:hypothetical protein